MRMMGRVRMGSWGRIDWNRLDDYDDDDYVPYTYYNYPYNALIHPTTHHAPS